MVSQNSYSVAVEKDDAAWDTVASGLFNYNHHVAGLKRTPAIAVIVRDKDNQVKGGLFGNSDWDVFNIDVVWITEEVRGQGFGQKLMQLGEDVAVSRGCKIAVVSTFSFQARGFYEKQGYKVFGQIDGYPAGYSSYWLTKKLTQV